MSLTDAFLLGLSTGVVVGAAITGIGFATYVWKSADWWRRNES